MGKKRRESMGLERSETPLHKREGSAMYRPKGIRKKDNPLGDDYFVSQFTEPDSPFATEDTFKTYEEAINAAYDFYKEFPGGYVEMYRVIEDNLVYYFQNDEGVWVPESELDDPMDYDAPTQKGHKVR